MFVLICTTVFEIQGSEISGKQPPQPLFCGNIATTSCSPGESRSPAIKEKKTLFHPSQDVLRNRSIWKTSIKNSFFNISKTIKDIERMLNNKFVDLKIFNIIYFLCTFWYLEPFLTYSDPKTRKNHPSPLILGKYYPDRAVQGRLSIPSLGKLF